MALPVSSIKATKGSIVSALTYSSKCFVPVQSQKGFHSFTRYCTKPTKYIGQFLQSSTNSSMSKLSSRTKVSGNLQIGSDRQQTSLTCKKLEKHTCRLSDPRILSALLSTSLSHLDKYRGTSDLENMPDLKSFLSEVGTDPREARYWLKQFTTSEPKKPFAVVQVDPEIFQDQKQLEHLTSCLSFLQRNSMRPVLVCGNHIASGHRFPLEELQRLKTQAVIYSTVLTSMLEANRVHCRPLFMGSHVIQAERANGANYCGTLCNINTEIIEWCLQTKHIPIILSFGETASGQLVALDLWSVTEGLAKALQPLKVIKVNACGGFVDEVGSVVANIHLPVDLETSGDKPWCTPVIRSSIERVYKLLCDMPRDSSVVITAVDKMLKELFTHRGSGTFFKITEPIHSYSTLEGIDIERLTELFTISFRKPLTVDYFKSIEEQLHAVYLSESYNAAAVILKDDMEVPYLCKFVVSVKAQGEGTGEMLWETLKRDHKQLYWRSKGDNPINSWYFRQSEGSWSNRDWTVFWYGIHQPSLSSKLIDSAISKVQSFEPAIQMKNETKLSQTDVSKVL
ncbi:N-acetylglutamate synthase, mitochondrial-like [Haliotis rubra]|uniref:N-acetylglutamate synthase, mitochondrial-like n=1 Tax=Haliotis rubra TaxID=36100 RepID=UPI001EE5D0FA|nr:N-acetylglutamate synthase, mitochondrial-like [Haliotis rubra]XP_046562546.1 N-acetylglutamate synthase, mitochondrial-like [Haliotis rubra]